MRVCEKGRGGGQALLFDRGVCDGGGVGLVDCDGLVVVEGVDLSVWGLGEEVMIREIKL